MNGSDGGDDDAARRDAKRERDRLGAQKRRKERRAAREASWKTTAATGGNVALLDVRPTALLQMHIARTAAFLEMLEGDEHTSLAEKTRCFVNAIPALARACETTEFADRLTDLEQRLAESQRRPGLRSV
jgi:hypothetical protein